MAGTQYSVLKHYGVCYVLYCLSPAIGFEIMKTASQVIVWFTGLINCTGSSISYLIAARLQLISAKAFAINNIGFCNELYYFECCKRNSHYILRALVAKSMFNMLLAYAPSLW